MVSGRAHSEISSGRVEKYLLAFSAAWMGTTKTGWMRATRSVSLKICSLSDSAVEVGVLVHFQLKTALIGSRLDVDERSNSKWFCAELSPTKL